MVSDTAVAVAIDRADGGAKAVPCDGRENQFVFAADAEVDVGMVAQNGLGVHVARGAAHADGNAGQRGAHTTRPGEVMRQRSEGRNQHDEIGGDGAQASERLVLRETRRPGHR